MLSTLVTVRSVASVLLLYETSRDVVSTLLLSERGKDINDDKTHINMRASLL